MIDLKFHVLTVATDLKKAGILVESARQYDIPVLNLGNNLPWRGAALQERGGGQKVNLMKRFLSTADDADIILFVDGYDVLINAPLQDIVEKFFEFDVDILFAAEKICWPEKQLADQFLETKTDYRYLNSGVYIGFAASLKQFFADPLADNDDDQLYMHQVYLTNLRSGGDINIALDSEAVLFQCVSAASDDIAITEDRQFLNKKTNTHPLILHGNGGRSDKRKFTDFSASLGISQTEIHFTPTNGQFDVIGPEILLTDFLTHEECSKLIAMADDYDEWKSMYGDKFPGQEIRLRVLDINLFNKLEAYFADDLNKIIEKYWWPTHMHGLRDAFIIKYSPETQTSLACHNDASMVSGIVKLNDGYEGGETWFHRQQFSTKYVPVGKMVLWPAQVTHGHEGREVTAGTKYALVIWTARHKRDLNY